MSKEYVEHFHHLTSTLLTVRERDYLHGCLRSYQRNGDVGKLAKAVKLLLTTPERTKLLAYIRAPMSKVEKNKFDKLLGVHSQGFSGSHQRHGYLSHITTPPGSVQSSSERLITIYGSRGGSMGFSIRGGSEFGLGIYVSNVRQGTPAAEAGLKVGDHILYVNGVDFYSVANSSAVKVLSSSALLKLVVLRSGKVPEWKVARERVLWYDVSLRRVVSSPPVTENPSASVQTLVLIERKVVIAVSQDSDYIGLNVRGGKEYGTGVYISRVDPGGLAERVGLAAGDQVIKVNERDFHSVTHTDAVDALRSSAHLIITIRSVGKYPVFKELYAEYTWSDGSGVKNNNVGNNSITGRLITVPGDNASSTHTQRTRARESSIDLVPLTSFTGNNNASNNHIELSDLDDAIEELDDALEQESKLCYPADRDIMFRRNYEDSWQAIDTLNDNYAHSSELTKSWAVDNDDSLGHYRGDSDSSDQMLDYATFLEHSAQRKELEAMKRNQMIRQNHTNQDEHVVIETEVEEGITSFQSTPYAQTSSQPGISRIENTYQVYSQFDDHSGQVKTESQGHIRSSPSSSGISTPVYATVNKTERSEYVKSHKAPDVPHNAEVNGVNNDQDEEDLQVLSSQIQRLEARKSSLGNWEITRVAGVSSPDHSDKSDSYDKQKMGTWSSLKKKLKGSLKLKSSGQKKRSAMPSPDAYQDGSPTSPTGSLHQKGVFERSFGSPQILNTPTSERYNLMGMLEDHARLLLTEDESKAVVRHVHNYHENKDLDRLVELLLTILDKPDKKLLLVDVRNVIAPSHIERYDMLVDECNLEGYDQWLSKYSATSDEPLKARPAKPARSKNGRIGNHDINGHGNTNQFSAFTKEDLEKVSSQLEVVIVETEDVENRASPVVEDGEEIVYISKHKIMLGLELCGGRNVPVDQTIRVKRVTPGGAAADDRRLQPGVEITKIDGKSVTGLHLGEAESLLQTAFSTKLPVNLGIQIRLAYHL